jgi:hypothetical protein
MNTNIGVLRICTKGKRLCQERTRMRVGPCYVLPPLLTLTCDDRTALVFEKDEGVGFAKSLDRYSRLKAPRSPPDRRPASQPRRSAPTVGPACPSAGRSRPISVLYPSLNLFVINVVRGGSVLIPDRRLDPCSPQGLLALRHGARGACESPSGRACCARSSRSRASSRASCIGCGQRGRLQGWLWC